MVIASSAIRAFGICESNRREDPHSHSQFLYALDKYCLVPVEDIHVTYVVIMIFEFNFWHLAQFPGDCHTLPLLNECTYFWSWDDPISDWIQCVYDWNGNQQENHQFAMIEAKSNHVRYMIYVTVDACTLIKWYIGYRYIGCYHSRQSCCHNAAIFENFRFLKSLSKIFNLSGRPFSRLSLHSK